MQRFYRMNEFTIAVDQVCLTYRMVHATSLKSQFVRNKLVKRPKVEQFQALKDITFSVEKGHTVGIIGSNGAGKSTLLKTLSGVLQPDSGIINIFSNSIALLTLGTGFEPDISGIENIFLNGALLGLKKKIIMEKLDEIINFADIGDFIYNPIRTYSTGMKARLAFAVASSIDPDILLIDEMLGVGDEEFKEKSKNKLQSMIQSDRTVIIVAHNMQTIRDYCNDVLWLEKGNLIKYGKTDEVVDEYLAYIKQKRKNQKS